MNFRRVKTTSTLAIIFWAVCNGGFSSAIAQPKSVFMKNDSTVTDWVDALKREKQDAVTRGLRVDSKPAGQKEEAPSPEANALITFKFNSAELTAEAKLLLDNLALALRTPELWGNKFRLEGHTDGVGSRGYNLKLSQRRAEAVRNYLISKSGIDGNMFNAIGKGKESLLDKANPKAAINRRVTIANIGG